MSWDWSLVVCCYWRWVKWVATALCSAPCSARDSLAAGKEAARAGMEAAGSSVVAMGYWGGRQIRNLAACGREGGLAGRGKEQVWRYAKEGAQAMCGEGQVRRR